MKKKVFIFISLATLLGFFTVAGLCNLGKTTTSKTNVNKTMETSEYDTMENVDENSENTISFNIENTKYNIGDVGPAGGLIFYVNPNYQADSWKYLEAVAGDILNSDNEPWFNWDNGNHILTGAMDKSIGQGKSNTEKIVSANGIGEYAAYICQSYILNGYDDWFLASKDELTMIYENLYINGFGSFWPAAYFSSTEHNKEKNWAWGQDFSDGRQTYLTKGEGYRIHPIRFVK